MELFKPPPPEGKKNGAPLPLHASATAVLEAGIASRIAADRISRAIAADIKHRNPFLCVHEERKNNNSTAGLYTKSLHQVRY